MQKCHLFDVLIGSDLSYTGSIDVYAASSASDDEIYSIAVKKAEKMYGRNYGKAGGGRLKIVRQVWNSQEKNFVPY